MPHEGLVHRQSVAVEERLESEGQIILIARILAGDHWTTITIPRGASSQFNQQVWGKGHYESQRTDQ